MIAKAKIDYFYAANLAVFIQDNHYVFGLDVAVHDVEGVQLARPTTNCCVILAASYSYRNYCWETKSKRSQPSTS
jgi:hypothetical protein